MLVAEEGYAADFAGSAAEGQTLAMVNDYDALVLDLGLPDGSGLDVLNRLRRNGKGIPVLILTGRRDAGLEVHALDAGADDYVVKPFGNEELKARLRALVRRGGSRRTEQVVYGDLHLNRLTRQLMKENQPLRLSSTELRMLEYFMLRPGEVVSRSELLDKLWDQNFDPDSNVIDVTIGRVRRKLAAVKSTVEIQNLRGSGFMMTLAGAAG